MSYHLSKCISEELSKVHYHPKKIMSEGNLSVFTDRCYYKYGYIELSEILLKTTTLKIQLQNQ